VNLKSIADFINHDKNLLFGIILLLIPLIAIIVSLISNYQPSTYFLFPKDSPPSLFHIMGTTSLGQDVFLTLMKALSNSLLIGILSALISRVLATLIGCFSGYKGGKADWIISVVTESFIVVPRLPLLILIAFSFKQQLDPLSMGFILAILDWGWPSKRYRSQILSLKEREFTQTSKFSGMGDIEIIFKEHMPFLIPYIIVDIISGIIWAIGMETTLSILGLFNLEIPTIGTTLYWANYYSAMYRGLWWWWGFPVIVMIVTIFGLYLLSVSLQNYLDPTTRIQRIKVS